MMLTAKNLTVRYGSLTILDDVSFEVDEGQWLMVVGPNGAGKSTLIGAVTRGIPFEGGVWIHGDSLARLKAPDLARRMGVLMQSNFVGYDYTVEEVVRLGRYAWNRRVLGGRSDEDDEQVEASLDITGMAPMRRQAVTTLSGGELQRTFLAQVLAQDPRLLILDEPANHLDLVYQRQVFGLLAKWAKKPGRAVMSVVHDLSLARAYGTHALLLHKGRRVALGGINEVLTRENLAGVYALDVYGWMRQLLEQWRE